MSEDVTLPALGESVTEGTVTRWLKSVGDTVEVDDPLVEVSTDKVDTEIPSPVAGTLLSITADEDDTVAVGGELAKIGDADAAPKAQESKPDPKPDNWSFPLRAIGAGALFALMGAVSKVMLVLALACFVWAGFSFYQHSEKQKEIEVREGELKELKKLAEKLKGFEALALTA